MLEYMLPINNVNYYLFDIHRFIEPSYVFLDFKGEAHDNHNG